MFLLLKATASRGSSFSRRKAGHVMRRCQIHTRSVKPHLSTSASRIIMNGQNGKEEHADCYVALELSRTKWLVGALLPESKKMTTIPVAGGDGGKLLSVLRGILAKAIAGYDGFWPARFLIDRGIDTTVLDASSFLVSRRGRRAKTDRVDVESMVFVLKAFLLGDRSVCRPVRIPSPEEEGAKWITRERTQLLKERTRNVNRIRALLNLQGIRDVRGLWVATGSSGLASREPATAVVLALSCCGSSAGSSSASSC
ncbi:MAG: hypothetical protein K2X43_00360 [Hyphomonadaceae bacterium]|nr:hypothetical protein [Hyphomonadaceae bacterium]